MLKADTFTFFGVQERSLKFFNTIYKVIGEVLRLVNSPDNCLVARMSDNAKSLNAALEVDCLDRIAFKLISINSKYFI